MENIKIAKRHDETGIRLLSNLSGAAGIIAALFWAYLAFEPRTVSYAGGPAVAVGGGPSVLLLCAAAGYLVGGFITAFLLAKFADALELLHEIRAAAKR